MSCSIAWTSSVHPRGRGEHFGFRLGRCRGSGSSPRARGTRAPPKSRYRPLRFIPAGAGNTLLILLLRRFCPVHPRGRGEHGKGRRVLVYDVGSSPRARGTPRMKYSNAKFRRFIPAGAGNTQREKATSGCYAVHPRGRGEHPMSILTRKLPTGSSPRARGTPSK